MHCECEGELEHMVVLHHNSVVRVSFVVAGSEVVYEGVPQLRENLHLPVWGFSARAKHAPGGAPAVVCLSQPKLVPNGIAVDNGETSEALLLILA